MGLRVWAVAAAMVVWAGAAWSGAAWASGDRTIMVQPLTAPQAEQDLAWAVTDMVQSTLYPHPAIHMLSAGQMTRLTGLAVPPSPADGAALARAGVDVVVGGRIETATVGLVLEAWRPGEAAPFWRTARPLPQAAALTDALAATLPELATALGLDDDAATARFARRQPPRGEAALRAHGAGARAYFDGDDPAAALPYFQTATQADPDSTDAWNYLGWSLVRQDRWDEAAAPFMTAIARNPDAMDARWGLQQALDFTGRFKEAATLRDAVPANHRDVLADRHTRAVTARDRAAAEAALGEMRRRAGQSPLRRWDVARHAVQAAETFDPAARPAELAESQAVAEALCGPCSLTQSTMLVRADALRTLGRAAEARPLEEQVRQRLESNAAPALSAHSRATLAGRLANLLARAEDWRAVARLRILRGDVLAEQAGAPTLEAAESWHRAAMVFANNQLSADPDAVPIGRRALETYAALRGAEDGDTAAATLTLGRLLHVGQPDQALPLFRRALEVTTRIHGPRHSDTALARYWVAYALGHKAEQAAEAEAMWRDALDSYRAAHGNRHAGTAVTLARYAEFLERRGRRADALPLRAESAAMREALGDPLEIGHAFYFLAKLERDMSRWTDADTHAARAVAAYETATAADAALWAARARGIQVAAILRLNRPAEAEALARRNLPIFAAVTDPEDSWKAYTLRQLGSALAQQNRPAEAQRELYAAIAAYEVVEPDSGNLAEALSDLADVLVDQDQAAEAIAARRRAIELWSRVYGPDSGAVGNEIWRLGHAQVTAGRDQEALDSFRRARDILTARDSLTPTGRISLTSSIATALAATRRLDEAAETHRQAVAEAERLEGPFGAATFWPRLRLGWTLDSLGDLPGAERLFRQAMIMALVSGNQEWQWAAGRDLGGIWLRQDRAGGAHVLLKMSANALQGVRAGQGWTPLGRRVQVFEMLTSALENSRDQSALNRVVELVEAPGAPADGKGMIDLTAAEQVWQRRLGELGRAAAPTAPDHELARQALDRAVDELSRRRASRESTL